MLTKFPRHTAWRSTLLVAVIAILCTTALGGFDIPGTGNLLKDVDSITRLLRVEQLYTTGRWYDNTLIWFAAPDGDELHWTRPLDVIILAITLPFLWIGLELRSALLIGGGMSGPLAGVAFTIALTYLAQRLSMRHSAILVPIATFAQPNLRSVFSWGSADHHHLILLLSCTSLVFVGLALLNDEQDRPGRSRLPLALAAISSALGVWVAVETIIVVILIGACLACMWVAGHRHAIDHLLRYAIWFAAGTATAIAIDPPSNGWLAISYERISTVHLACAGSLILVPATMQVMARLGMVSTPGRRIFAGAAISTAIGLGLLGLFPGLAASPTELFGPRVKQILFDTNSGFVPLGDIHSIYDVAGLVWHLGSVAIATGTLAVLVKRSDTTARIPLAGVAAAMLLLAIASIVAHNRWSASAQVLAVLPVVWLATREYEIAKGRILLACAQTVLVIAGPFLVVLAIFLLDPPSERKGGVPVPYASLRACEWHELAGFWQSDVDAPSARPIILGPLFDGPQIAWHTGLRVVGAPYGDVQSTIDTADAFSSTDFSIMHDVIVRRGISHVAVCAYQPDDVQRTGNQTAEEHLRNGDNVPNWLQPVEAPEEISRLYRLYRFTP